MADGTVGVVTAELELVDVVVRCAVDAVVVALLVTNIDVGGFRVAVVVDVEMDPEVAGT